MHWRLFFSIKLKQTMASVMLTCTIVTWSGGDFLGMCLQTSGREIMRLSFKTWVSHWMRETWEVSTGLILSEFKGQLFGSLATYSPWPYSGTQTKLNILITCTHCACSWRPVCCCQATCCLQTGNDFFWHAQTLIYLNYHINICYPVTKWQWIWSTMSYSDVAIVKIS